MHRMIPELSIHESYDWLRSTLEHLASIPRLNDADFDYIVFEVLDVDVRSALSEVALDRLIFGHALSDSAKREILSLRSAVLVLIDVALAAAASSNAQVWRDHKWLDVAQSSERILSEYVHGSAA